MVIKILRKYAFTVTRLYFTNEKITIEEDNNEDKIPISIRPENLKEEKCILILQIIFTSKLYTRYMSDSIT
jgi:hypothetical protein